MIRVGGVNRVLREDQSAEAPWIRRIHGLFDAARDVGTTSRVVFSRWQADVTGWRLDACL